MFHSGLHFDWNYIIALYEDSFTHLLCKADNLIAFRFWKAIGCHQLVFSTQRFRAELLPTLWKLQADASWAGASLQSDVTVMDNL